MGSEDESKLLLRFATPNPLLQSRPPHTRARTRQLKLPAAERSSIIYMSQQSARRRARLLAAPLQRRARRLAH